MTKKADWEIEFENRFVQYDKGVVVGGFELSPYSRIKSFIRTLLIQQQRELLDFVKKQTDQMLPIVGKMKHNEALLRLCNIELNLPVKKTK